MDLKPLPLLFALTLSPQNAVLAETTNAPDLLLAKEFQANIDLSQFLVSEKLDGVRALWTGKQFVTRKGNVINAPKWFTKNFPKTKLDGELWIGRNQFELLSGTVRKHQPIDEEWRAVKFMVFDKPDSPLTFLERSQQLKTSIAKLAIPHLNHVEQRFVKSRQALDSMLSNLVAKGGEGLMLHRASSTYQGGRSSDLLKFKTHQDAEARVVAHIPAKGSFAGMMGSLLVEMPDGKQFRVGTGFTIEQRKNPPEIGELITYRFRGTTNKGTPRFASFVRVRDEF